MIDPTGLPILELATAVGVGLAFAKGARYELLKRDRFTCQNEDCIGNYLGIGALSWGKDFNINGAHYPDRHQRMVDNNIENGRCLCVHCHIVEEIQRGNHGGAGLLWQSQTIRNANWIKEHGYENPKMDFFFYMDWVRASQSGDVEKKYELARTFADIMKVDMQDPLFYEGA